MRFGGAQHDRGSGIAALPDGSCLVTGDFRGSAAFESVGTSIPVLTAEGGADIFVARYNPDGRLEWARQDGGSGHTWPRDIAALPGGSFLVTGGFEGSLTLGFGDDDVVEFSSDVGSGIFLARYDQDGILVWARRADCTREDQNTSIAALPDGSFLLGGDFQETATFGPGESNETTLYAGDRTVIGGFLARYHSDGTLAWVRHFGAVIGDNVRIHVLDISAAPEGSSLVTGVFSGIATFAIGEDNQTTLTSSDHPSTYQPRVFLARHHADGTLDWVRSVGSRGEGHFRTESCGVTTLSDGSNILTGEFYQSVLFGAGEANETELVSEGETDVFIAMYTPRGQLAWARKAGGEGHDYVNGIAALPDGGLWVTGSFRHSATFGPGEPKETTLVADRLPRIFVARYDSEGNLVWVRHADGTGQDNGKAVAVFPDGSAVVTGSFGYSGATSVFGPGETNEATLTSAGLFDVFVMRLGP